MSQESDRHSDGASRDNPIIILDSPSKRLAPRAPKRGRTAFPASIPHNADSVHTVRGSGFRKKRRVSFELYSHATDKHRLLKSVYSVAGKPILSHTAQARPEVVDLTSDDEQPTPATHQHTVTDNATVCPPFHKFSQGVLETLMDSGLDNTDRLKGYLQLTEQLLAHGYCIPVNRVPQVINVVLEASDRQTVNKLHSLLCQDLHLRPPNSNNLPIDSLQDILHTVTSTLCRIPTHHSSQVVLHYITALKPSFGHLPSTLIHNLLDIACTCVSMKDQGSLPSPTHTALTLCVHHSSHCMVRELSTRINKLPSKQLKCAMLQSIPSTQFRLKVIDHHLTQYFRGPTNPTTGLSFKEMCTVHFQRSPYEHNGLPQDLSYFLTVLLLLLETGLNSESVECVRECVTMLLERLHQDTLLLEELSTVWYQLQLLHAFT